jgi:hypothetical protein
MALDMRSLLRLPIDSTRAARRFKRRLSAGSAGREGGAGPPADPECKDKGQNGRKKAPPPVASRIELPLCSSLGLAVTGSGKRAEGRGQKGVAESRGRGPTLIGRMMPLNPEEPGKAGGGWGSPPMEKVGRFVGN